VFVREISTVVVAVANPGLVDTEVAVARELISRTRYTHRYTQMDPRDVTQFYTVSQKTRHPTLVHNFTKY